MVSKYFTWDHVSDYHIINTLTDRTCTVVFIDTIKTLLEILTVVSDTIVDIILASRAVKTENALACEVMWRRDGLTRRIVCTGCETTCVILLQDNVYIFSSVQVDLKIASCQNCFFLYTYFFPFSLILMNECMCTYIQCRQKNDV